MSRLARRVVVLVAVALLLTSCKFDGAYDLPLPGGPVDADDAITVTAEFDDILNIVPKSPVMVDDVTVGEVTDVERVGWHAKITMIVRKDVDLPDNAIAEIRQVSLLGEKYVALEPPAEGASDDRLGDGDNIPLVRTGRNPEVEEVLGALSFLLSGGGVAQLGTITQELNKAMDGRQENLRHLLGSLTDVVGTLDDQKADIIRAMESVTNLTATLNREKQTVSGALDVAGPAVKVLADQHDELIAMLSALDRLGVVGTRVIGASKDDLLESLAHLKPVLSRLRAAGDQLAPGLNLIVSFPFPKEASEIVRGDYANTSIRADINLENFLPAGTTIPNLPIPEIPTPDLPPAGQVLSDVQKCLQSLDITSQACQKVLADVDLLTSLKKKCKKDRHAANPVCTVLNTVPDAPLDELGDLLGGLLGGGLRPDDARQPVHPRSLRAAMISTSRKRPEGRSARRPTASAGTAEGMIRGGRIRIAAFLVLSAVGIVYITASYLGFVDRVLGRGITVHATLPTSGGLFEGSEVTYRGVKIGKVSQMHATAKGVTLDLALEEGTELPKDSPMYVHNLSAVGEQYLDFEPADDEAAVRRGRRHAARQRGVAARRRGRPAGRAELVRRARSTSRSSRPWSASSGRCSTTPAEPLQQLLDNGWTFIDEASAHTAETRALLDDGLTVLQTQEGESENIRSFSNDLARITKSLKDSDADLRTTLSETPATAREVDRCSPSSSRRCRSCWPTRPASARSGSLHLAGLEQLLVVFPHVISSGFTGTPGDGYGHVNLQLDQEVQPCTEGLPAARPVAATLRPLGRTDLPGPVHGRGAVRPARHAVLARRPDGTPGASYRGGYDPTSGVIDGVVDANGNPVHLGEQGNLSVLGDDAWKWLLVGPVVATP